MIKEREIILQRIERLAAEFIRDGSVAKWSSGRDDVLINATQGVNGPLLELLCEITHDPDIECVALFRDGAPLFGTLATSGNGTPLDLPASTTPDELLSGRLSKNIELTAKGKPDAHSAKLMEIAKSDAALGRNTEPKILDEAVMTRVNLTPRFGVRQGSLHCLSLYCMNIFYATGAKVRAVDDFTRSMVGDALISTCTKCGRKFAGRPGLIQGGH